MEKADNGKPKAGAPAQPAAKPVRYLHLYGFQVIGTLSPRWDDKRQIKGVETMSAALLN